jgi:hypothetical protein
VPQQVTLTSALGSHPYLTKDEYKQAPTSVDVDDFVGGGSMALNDVELENVLARASSWIDSHCNQVLAATVDTETFRGRASRDGFLRIHPRYSPVVTVVSASFGSNPQAMQTLDVSTAWIEDSSVVFPLTLTNASFLGPIQFSRIYQPLAEQFIEITYVNGYANSLISSTANIADTQISVSDMVGFVPNLKVTIFDGVSTEIVTVASTFVPNSGPGTVTLAAPLMNAHAVGVSVSAMPPAIKQACIYVTNVILKSRGNSALVMNTLTASQVIGNNPAVANDFMLAVDLLRPFRRIR